jgi:hypothetical protein
MSSAHQSGVNTTSSLRGWGASPKRLTDTAVIVLPIRLVFSLRP